jgi:sulfate/thiosulfate transport system ATP-binding protein
MVIIVRKVNNKRLIIMGIRIENISKSFGEFEALKDINLSIETGELVALLGPSGSGKTTLLRIIAGLESPDKGSVYTYGQETTDKSPRERKIGFVFQHYALFKHMTVFENVAFGLRVRPKSVRPSDATITRKVNSLLKLIHMDKFTNCYPKQLSGGQRQRVALARSLAVEPKILLLDEPFGALDSKVRKVLRRWIRKLHDDFDITTIFVTHDQEEAMEVADRVAILKDGEIIQVGTPSEVYNNPDNSFVYDFLGNFNIFQGVRDANGEAKIIDYENKGAIASTILKNRKWLKKTKLGTKIISLIKFSKKFLPDNNKSTDSGNYIEIFARPHDMEIVRKTSEKDYIPAKITHINPAGPLVKIELEQKDESIIQAEITQEEYDQLKLKKGERVYTKAKEVMIFE